MSDVKRIVFGVPQGSVQGMDGFSGGFGGGGGGGGVQTPQGWVNTPPENAETPPEKLETPPEISLIFNIPNYSLNYFTTMKLF